MHWVQDCYRASDIPNHEHFDEEVLFEALSMAQIRRSDMELVATNSKAADPGKFKDERKWPEWEKAFTNYLSVIPGVSGIPLSYIVREQDEPTPGMDYSTFNERIIRRPLLLTMSINGNFFFVSDIYMLQMKHLLSFGNLNIVWFYCLIVSLNNMCFLITTLNVEP